MKITIKNRYTDAVIIEGEADSLKDYLQNNRGADLRGADLRGANLRGADTIKGGVSKEYMKELEKHQQEAEFIENNL